MIDSRRPRPAGGLVGSRRTLISAGRVVVADQRVRLAFRRDSATNRSHDRVQVARFAAKLSILSRSRAFSHPRASRTRRRAAPLSPRDVAPPRAPRAARPHSPRCRVASRVGGRRRVARARGFSAASRPRPTPPAPRPGRGLRVPRRAGTSAAILEPSRPPRSPRSRSTSRTRTTSRTRPSPRRRPRRGAEGFSPRDPGVYVQGGGRQARATTRRGCRGEAVIADALGDDSAVLVGTLPRRRRRRRRRNGSGGSRAVVGTPRPDPAPRDCGGCVSAEGRSRAVAPQRVARRGSRAASGSTAPTSARAIRRRRWRPRAPPRSASTTGVWAGGSRRNRSASSPKRDRARETAWKHSSSIPAWKVYAAVVLAQYPVRGERPADPPRPGRGEHRGVGGAPAAGQGNTGRRGPPSPRCSARFPRRSVCFARTASSEAAGPKRRRRPSPWRSPRGRSGSSPSARRRARRGIP